jgi:hypothetical protein
MGVQYDSTRDRFVVRWVDDGKERCRRFKAEDDAAAAAAVFPTSID